LINFVVESLSLLLFKGGLVAAELRAIFLDFGEEVT
jgi:hypothetical protein